jgi:ferric iron reductase protein FhuF
VLPGDPLAASRHPGVLVVTDQDALLETLRATLLDDHLAPVQEEIRRRVNLGRRTLLGSVASGVSYALARATDSVPGSTLQAAQNLLTALGIADLVELSTRPDGELGIQRRTCCLAFTLPDPKICSSCCIR